MGRLEDILVEFARGIGGEWDRKNRQVVTPAENWTIVLDGELDSNPAGPITHEFSMWANYAPIDGFEFKVGGKGVLHDLLGGRIFGSHDIDIVGGQWQREYSVESNDEDRVRNLFGNKTFFGYLLDVTDEESGFFIEVEEGVVGVQIIEAVDAHAPQVVYNLAAAHNLIVETLRALVDMGSASPEGVEPVD